jgi:hypothetical protein
VSRTIDILCITLFTQLYVGICILFICEKYLHGFHNAGEAWANKTSLNRHFLFDWSVLYKQEEWGIMYICLFEWGIMYICLFEWGIMYICLFEWGIMYICLFEWGIMYICLFGISVSSILRLNFENCSDVVVVFFCFHLSRGNNSRIFLKPFF